MNTTFNMTLLIAMFSLFIIGLGDTAPAEAAGTCAETPLVNTSAVENTALIGCQGFEADAARYTGLAAFYTPKAAGTCLEIAATDTIAVALVNCRSDSGYLAANPELMASHRFAAVDDSAFGQPVSVDKEALRQRIHSNWVIEADAVDVSILEPPARDIDFNRPAAFDPGTSNVTSRPATFNPGTYDKEALRRRVYSDRVEAEPVNVDTSEQPTQGNVIAQPVSIDIQTRNHNYYDNLWAARQDDLAAQADAVAEHVEIESPPRSNPGNFHPGH